MRVPNADSAAVDISKLRDYCLNPSHELGKHKARVFAAVLDMRIGDEEYLKTKLIEAVKSNDAAFGMRNRYGQRFTVDFDLEKNGKVARVRSIWIVDTVSTVPRLISCYVL